VWRKRGIEGLVKQKEKTSPAPERAQMNGKDDNILRLEINSHQASHDGNKRLQAYCDNYDDV